MAKVSKTLCGEDVQNPKLKILKPIWWMLAKPQGLKILSAFIFLVIFVPEIPCAWSGTLETEPIGDYFDSMSRKPTPLWFCRGWIDGIKWRIPKPIQCPIMPIDAPSKVVNVTIWWQDISLRTLKGYECYAKKSVKVVTFYFFGAKTYDSWTEKYPITEEECHQMTLQRVTPAGQGMNYQRDGFFSTDNHPNPSSSWLRTVREEVINYFFVALQFTISNKDDTVQSTTKMLDSCHFSLGACFSELGITTWSIYDIQTCRLRKGSSTACVLTGKRLSCPEISMSTHNIKYVDICGEKIGLGDTGLLFTQDSVNDTNLGTIVSSVLEKKITKRKVRNVLKNRDIFQIWMNNTLPPPTFASNQEINSRFQYLYDLVAGNVTYALQQFHIEICKTNKVLLDMMRSIASGGNPTTLVRALLGEPSYTARLNGDVVSIWKCTPIYEYMFQHNNQCTIEHPIKYMDGHVNRTGWVVPISHEIVETPAKTTCPGPNFYFETEDGVILLNNRSLVSNIPVLPSFHSDVGLGKYQMPALSFTAPGAYGAEDLGGEETVLGMIRHMQTNYILDNAVKRKIEGSRVELEHANILEGLANFIYEPLITLFHSFVTVLVVVVVIYIVIRYRKCIYKILCKNNTCDKTTVNARCDVEMGTFSRKDQDCKTASAKSKKKKTKPTYAKNEDFVMETSDEGDS